MALLQQPLTQITMTSIYHNPRCSKSRQTLQLLLDNGVDPTIIEYLKQPPTTEELIKVLELLNLEPRELMRQKEAIYGELGLADPTLSRAVLIDAMVQNPILIERPIVIHHDRAAIGRPPEQVLELF